MSYICPGEPGPTPEPGFKMEAVVKWPRAKRAMIPEVVGYHPESTDATMSANWYGRKTAPFRHQA